MGASVRGSAAPEIWRFPLDPGLPALATATDEEAVRELLTSYGIPDGPVSLDVRSYRPRRRAVVEVHAPDCRLFLKVVRPRAVEGLHDRHRLLRDAGLPVPRSLGWSANGLLVLEALSGTSLRSRLRAGGPVPDGAALVALLDRLPPEVCALRARRSWTDAVEHYAGVLGACLPTEASRAAALAAEVQARTAGRPADQPSHGDFYESQLLLDGSRIRGLLDVDTVGPGRRADDLACLLAHVSVLALMEPAHAVTTDAFVARWLADFDRRTDPAELRARVAGVVVSLATGPYRVQETDWEVTTRDRLDLAERWLALRG
jgi:aminoglycoside phosphotransferase